MAKLVDSNIYNAMRNVAEALKLDGQSRVQEAYIQYLQSVHFIAQVLLEDAKTHDRRELSGNNTKKFIALGQQCMDRVAVVVDKLDREEPSEPLILSESPSPPYYLQSPTSPTMPPGVHGSSPYPYHSPVSPTVPHNSQTTTQSFASRQNSIAARPAGTSGQTVTSNVAGPARPDNIHGTRSLGPTETAYRQNQLLMAAYKARVARLNSGDSAREFNLSLTLQRRMAENIAIAKAQERALARKMHERQRRLEEQAARRFASTTGMSKDEQERRRVYTEILMYEHDHRWPLSWRERLKASPQDGAFIQELVKKILSAADHPLTTLLKQYQFNIYNKINPLVSSHVQQVSDIRVPYHDHVGEKNSGDAGVKRNSQEEKSEERSVSSKHNSQVLDSEIGKSRTENTSPESLSAQYGDSISQERILDGSDQTCCKLDKENDKDNGIGELDTSTYSVDDMDDLFEDTDETYQSDSAADLTCLTAEQQTAQSTDGDVEGVDDEVVLRLTIEGFQRHLRIITKDVHVYLDKMQSMFIVCYEELDSPTGRDICYACIEEPFFKPIWGYLLALFRLANRDREITLARSMTKFENLSPKAMNVSDKLTLMSKDSLATNTMTADAMTTDYPYKAAVEHIRKLPSFVCPLNKLECIVQVSKLICQCVVEYYDKDPHSEGSIPSIGADDLLPILSFVVTCSKLPQLISECHAMGEFIHEAYLMGEEGYCLTSLQTALSYVSSLADSG